MFKNRFLLVLGVFSLLLVTMALSRPFSSRPASSIEGANDFYQRHPGWSRSPDTSDYYRRHAGRRESAAPVIDLTGDFALRHPEWTIDLQFAAVPVTAASAFSDYFQRHPELRKGGRVIDLTDYFFRQ